MPTSAGIKPPPVTTMPIPTRPVVLTPLQKQQVEAGTKLDGIREQDLPVVAVRAQLLRALEKMDSLAGFFEGGHLSKSAYVNALLKPENADIGALNLARRMYIEFMPLPPARPC